MKFIIILVTVLGLTFLLVACTSGNHTLTSVCYKEKYNTLLLDGARTVKQIVKDDCYKRPEILRWQFKKTY
tara:strand:- start:391 stop:603 length:213 start_codon:yes stop_codon:yes gene_type:complete